MKYMSYVCIKSFIILSQFYSEIIVIYNININVKLRKLVAQYYDEEYNKRESML